MILGFNVVFPLIGMILLGMFLQKKKVITSKSTGEMNSLVFRVLLPAQLFLNAYQVDVAAVWTRENLMAAGYLLLGNFLVIIIAYYGCTAFGMDKKRRTIIVQGIYRSNLVLFGLPVAMSVYNGELPEIASLIILLIVPFYNIVAVFLFESALDQSFSFVKSLAKVFQNPLVVGTLLGVFINLAGVTLFTALIDTISRIASMATPLAFIVLGSSLNLNREKSDTREVFQVSFLKLVLVPMIILGVAVLLGVRGGTLTMFISATASPVAVTSFNMAKEKKVESELAGKIVASTTLLSGITLFAWISLFSYWGML